MVKPGVATFRLITRLPFEVRTAGRRFVLDTGWVDCANHFELQARDNGSEFKYWVIERFGSKFDDLETGLYQTGFDVPSGTVPFAIFRKLVEQGDAEKIEAILPEKNETLGNILANT